MLDLDELKKLNDHKVHTLGDALIKIAGAVISDSLRQNDLKARLGGDEFAFLLASVPLHRVAYFCEHILSAFKAQTGSSISIGAAFSTEPSPDLHVFLGVADDTSRMVKSTGKGQIEVVKMKPQAVPAAQLSGVSSRHPNVGVQAGTAPRSSAP